MKRSLKREVDEMGDLESPGGPPVPEAGGRNSEFSRNRLGVGVRREWSTPSSGKKRGQPTGARSPDTNTIRTRGRFTNTAVPKFDGDGCWQQHLQIFNAIAKSNGWADETATLQLFVHLERLAVFRRKFESVTRRTGADPATFTTESEILAVRGFEDMGTCARNRMVRDRFIVDQRSCGLRRHLDSVPPDTPIREIVDRCRVWESHSEQKRGSSPGTDLDRYPWLV